MMLPRLIALLALVATASAQEIVQDNFYCDCECNGDVSLAGIWIAATHPSYNEQSVPAPKLIDGVYHSYACLSDSEVFDILSDAQGACDLCDDDDNTGRDDFFLGLGDDHADEDDDDDDDDDFFDDNMKY